MARRVLERIRDAIREQRYDHTVHGTGADGTTPVGSAGRFTETGRYLIITAYEVSEE